MEKRITRMIAMYYDACRNGEKKRAELIYKQLYKAGVVLIPRTM